MNVQTTNIKKTIHNNDSLTGAVATLHSQSQQENYIFGYYEEKKKGFAVTILSKSVAPIKRQQRASAFTRELEV